MEKLTERIDKLFAENKGAEAKLLMIQALQEAYDKGDMAGAVPILNELIGYCRETGLVRESYAYAEEVQEILHKLGLEGSLPHATTLLNIANAYRAGGNLEESLQKYGEVVVIYKNLLQDDDMLWASLFNNVSLLYQELGRFDLAKESLLKALQIVVGKKDTVFEQAVTYTNLANTCLQLGQGEEAEKYFTGAILLFEKYHIKDTHYCAALSALATYQYQRKEYEKAQVTFTKAMEGIEAHLGRNEYYERMRANAQLCRELAQLQESVQAAQEGITIQAQDTKSLQEQMQESYAQEDKEPLGKPSWAEDFVKGMELCREYYEAFGKPMLEAKFPQYMDKLAVGLVGEGSDCFGYDDVHSKDHDWGPGFCIWVNEQVYEEIGDALQQAYEGLPKEYKGYTYKATIAARGRRGVCRIKDFYQGLLGQKNCPKEGEEWTAQTIGWEGIADDRLAAATNGEVFQDASGEFSHIRTLLKAAYPEHLRYLKLAEAVARFSQAGQYNLDRMLKRGDLVTAQLMQAEAIKEAMKLLYYVAGEYPPHDKWLYGGLQEKPEYRQALVLIKQTLAADWSHKAVSLETLATELAHLLYRTGYISDVDSFLQAHVNELLYKASVAELSIEELAEQIARKEFEAFDKVKNQGGRADCQDDWFTFSIMRKSQYLTWSKVMLMQYLYDFTRELERGHNLIEEKYGRMMESTAPAEYEKIKAHFPVLSQEKKQIIEQVVSMQVKWMEDFAAEYPKLAGNARSIHTYEDNCYNTSYETYLRGEISTYSDKMLELYGRYVVTYAEGGKNPAEEIMRHSVLMYGYEGLKEAEAVL